MFENIENEYFLVLNDKQVELHWPAIKVPRIKADDR